MDTLTQRNRAQQLLLRKQTLQQVETVWPTLKWDNLDGTYEALAARVGAVVRKNAATSANLSAAYIRQYRAKHGPNGRVDIVRGGIDADQLAATLHSQSVAAAKGAAGRGVAAEVAMNNALTLAAGAMARLVLNAGRDTVVQTVRSDNAARGWQRVLGGGGCDFCQMLAGRGAVYGEDTADFEAHSRCGCTAEPVYG